MATLKGTPFEMFYALMGSTNDDEALSRGYEIAGIVVGLSIMLSCNNSFWSYGKFSLDYNEKRIGIINNLIVSSKTTWMVGYLSSWVVPLLVVLFTPCLNMSSFSSILGLAMFVFSYFHRSMIYHNLISPNATPCHLWLCLSMAGVGALNAFLQAHHLMNMYTAPFTFPGLIGILLYVAGFLITKYHDQLLTQIKRKPQAVGKKNYSIPSGGLFAFVACPHYFGEIIQWWGFALVTKGSPQILFAIYITYFLGTRAAQTQRFYIETFEKAYPSARKTIIPFIL